MAKFFDEVKTILNDVEEFLPQVKDSKLNTKGRKLKKEIQQQIQQLRDEKPQLSTTNAKRSTLLKTPQTTSAPEDGNDLYEVAEFTKNEQNPELLTKNVPASERDNIVCEGKLKYRKEKARGKYKMVKQWCVLRGKTFYIYDKSSSKKQTECFFTDGYQVTPMEKEVRKKEESFPFEMIQQAKKTYVFFASTAVDQKMWVDYLNQATGIGSRERPVTFINDDLYDDMEDVIQPAPEDNTPSGDSYDNNDLYDATDPGAEPPQGYDDDPLALYDSTMDPGEDDGQGETILETSQSPPPVPVKGRPITNGMPGRADRVTSMASRAPRYSDMYYGIWDNQIQYPQELAFRRGDVITVVSKQFEDKGWWVGQLNNDVGLVPVSYLTPAYERV